MLVCEEAEFSALHKHIQVVNLDYQQTSVGIQNLLYCLQKTHWIGQMIESVGRNYDLHGQSIRRNVLIGAISELFLQHVNAVTSGLLRQRRREFDPENARP